MSRVKDNDRLMAEIRYDIVNSKDDIIPKDTIMAMLLTDISQSLAVIADAMSERKDTDVEIVCTSEGLTFRKGGEM